MNKNITASFLPQLGTYMKDTKTISIHSAHTQGLYFGSPEARSYMWDNLIIEKKISVGWLYKLYEDSIFHDFVVLFTAPVN